MYELFINSGEIFLHILNISITASWLVLAVLCARLLLKKAPKWVNCLLWGIVALRLLVPINIESALSLVPSSETIPVTDIYTTQVGAQSFMPQIDSGFAIVDSAIQPIITETSTQPVLQSNVSIIACIWLVGVVAMLVYAFISFLKVKKSIAPAMKLKENIYICDNIATPFILGIVKPKIFLPSSLYKEDVLYVIDHEMSHIKRLDHLWKPLGFLVLSVYWFNPVMWFAYVFLCKDIELACDEKAIKDFDIQEKKEYSNALINCSSQRRLVSVCPLAFGETGVKNRIKSVLNYKKPAFWVIVIAILLCVLVSVGFFTVPKSVSARDILDEKGYKIVAQEDAVIPVSVPVSALTDEIYNEKGQKFKENQVMVFEYDNTGKSFCQTNIYLEEAIMRESNIDLSFRFSYDELQDCGVIYSGYYAVDNWYPNTINVKDVNTLKIDGENYYENDVAVKFWAGSVDSKGEIGFSVSVSKDAFFKAKDKIIFDVTCTKTGYEKNSRYRLIDDDLCDFIEQTILEKEGWTTTQDKFSCVSFIPLKAEKVNGNTKVYLCAQWNEYEMVNGSMAFSGEKTPCLATITIKKDSTGYSIVDYWILEEYKSTTSQIQEHFPKKQWDEANNGFGYYYDILRMKNLVKAEEYFSQKYKEYVGKYVYYGSDKRYDNPSLLLKENGEAIFNIASYSSYMPVGRYTIDRNTLTLVDNDSSKQYTFKITDKGFEFDAFNSSELPVFKEQDTLERRYPVPHGAVFIAEHTVGANSYFKATILDMSGEQLLVEPFPDEAVCKSANKIYVPLTGWVHGIPPKVGDKVMVCYDGMLQETFPAQVNNVISVSLIVENEGEEKTPVNYRLGNEGVKYIEVVTDELVDELEGERNQTKKVITDQEKIQSFIKNFNVVLESSSIDELDEEHNSGICFDSGFDVVIYINVYAADESCITITLPGTERIRLGNNKRRMITSYERQILLDTLYDSRQEEIDYVISGSVGKVDLSNEEFLKKAYTLTNDMGYKELCDVFGCSPSMSSSSSIKRYYYFNDEYVLFVEKGIQVSLRKIYDPDYRHTIG